MANNRLPSVLETAHTWVAGCVEEGDPVIDATVGNGHDSLFLAAASGRDGRLFGFDIQPDALKQAEERLAAAPEAPGGMAAAHWFCRSHADMLDVLPREVSGNTAAVMFNLGYLPGGDKSVITMPKNTLRALDIAVGLLRPGGIVTVVAYTGHAGGKEEADAVLHWMKRLPQQEYQSMLYRFLNRRGDPPFLTAVQKRHST